MVIPFFSNPPTVAIRLLDRKDNTNPMHSFTPSLSFLLFTLTLPLFRIGLVTTSANTNAFCLAAESKNSSDSTSFAQPGGYSESGHARHIHFRQGTNAYAGVGLRSHAELSNILRERSIPDSDLPSPFIDKRAPNARFSHYVTGLGACGTRNVDSDFVVAINNPQWDNGAHCYKTITISYQGKTTQAQIVDRCMECPYNALDLTNGLFTFLGDMGLGHIYGDWEYADGAPKPAPSPTPKPTPIPTPKPTTQTTTPVAKPSTISSTVPPTTSSTTTSTIIASTPIDQPQNIQGMYLAVLGMAGVAIGALG
ncbi:RlpA-like double-psi beta-barrel-protein domain-containing protein-containing protein [Crassisporium funariophilum]|nr:RlpA-like double-psi beta-barrel-protein domain-containing protein-containing protein [Crassisporium funariophilum]